MSLLGYLSSVIIGIMLGLLGSGGSILTVPVLVYLLHFSPLQATGYSLFIVGITSLIGASSFMYKRLVDYKTAMLFAIPSFISVYGVRRFLLPLIPNDILTIGSFLLHKDMLIMLVFALLMLVAAISMIRTDKPSFAEDTPSTDFPKFVLIGFIVGGITGFVSVGGGFLIVPALVLFAKIPIRMAVGTSLFVIAVNALVGFAGELHHQVSFDWFFLFYFCLFSAIGIFAGIKLSHRIPAFRLKPIFGWFVLFMGCYIFIKEILS